MAGGDEADHDIQGNMMIIWAHGQQTSFYQEDQLKFHSKPFSGISAVGKFNISVLCFHITLHLSYFQSSQSLPVWV